MKNSQEIGFIDSKYKTLFTLPNGGFIQEQWDDFPIVKQCMFIDPYHTQIGNMVFHICEYAKLIEKRGITYEPESDSDCGAWKIAFAKYLAIQICDKGYDYSLLNKKSEVLDGGILERTDLSMMEARTEILKFLGFTPKELLVMDYEKIMENV